MSPVKQLVESTIADNKVAIFSKSWCPYCARAKKLLTTYPGLDQSDVKILELDLRDDGSEIQSYLQSSTGQRTVPNIFINQEHIGGSDDLSALERSGKLKTLVAA
ncbi:putative GRX1-glutaredoxin [Sistotremastrum niveocremeum HHB9708]|uniref:Putative GRX1-glutaredoxin n=2 Tax=Sistotremastraceae TaxID=3402574 RepID=A0A164UMW4_9AGAM|nr:putative GRX1-glutaredoxin [Sistotremastrum niveocremeum HHB9708]KZT43815.1 putative GRX1-glutaredoxin [Sistotremastrum suecicum HHB10207 ss-3]